MTDEHKILKPEFVRGSVLCLIVGALVAPATAVLNEQTLAEYRLPDDVWAGNRQVRAVLAPASDFSQAEKFEAMQGGAGTTRKTTDTNALSHQTQTLDFEGLNRFKLGNALFNKLWVSSPASTHASDGLGPFFNARACQSCHIKDGRGNLPAADENPIALVLQTKRELAGEWIKDPHYGNQLQTLAVPGVQAEAKLTVTRTAVTQTDRLPVELSQLSIETDGLAYGNLHPDTKLSPRMAPAMTGLGLLEAIDEAHLLSYADPQDANGDGISGRANWEYFEDGTKAMGRFGLKASMSSIKRQTAGAFLTDMGLSSPVFIESVGDCTENQTVCDTLADGVQPHLGREEVSEEILQLVTFYSSHLAVPHRRNVSDRAVLAGKEIFYESGCISCHTPKHVTAKDAAIAEHRYQLIWPYTDLLLHDMGEGLADGAGDGEANGREWRTPPLWGIGLTKQVNPNATWLHDGRARTLMEAILWHGGEAQNSRDRIVALEQQERDALITFLNSL